MRKKALLLAVALCLFALPLVVRWLYYYQGGYEPGPVDRPDLAAIEAPAPEIAAFTERPTVMAPHTVLFDAAHDNRFSQAELSVLQARLAARGLDTEEVVSSEDLADQLRYAHALVVISPGRSWTPGETQRVRDFVDKGGRVVLITDPTRFGVLTDEQGEYLGLDSDVDYISNLGAEFGLVFQADYLYNTVESEGNYRNIKLTDLAEHELTEGLDQVVFYAAHSIVSDEPVLIAGSGDTRSSSNELTEDLPVAVLAEDGQVLALGDLTFMIEPHNTVYDNDQLIANMADFLGGAERQYDQVDFPYFFEDQVDLVYAGDPLLDTDLLREGSTLQDFFGDVSMELMVREEEDPSADTIIFGLYEEAAEAEPYLESAQVTLWISPTEASKAAGEGQAAPSSIVTPAVELAEPSTLDGESAGPESGPTEEVSPTLRNRIEIGGLGAVALSGTSLFLLQFDGDREVQVVLADTRKGLQHAVARLTGSGFEGCLLQEAKTLKQPSANYLALCSTGEVLSGQGDGGWPEPDLPATDPASNGEPTNGEDQDQESEPVEPVGASKRILVVALDDGEARYDGLTSLDDYVLALQSRFEITQWTQSVDGSPAFDDYLTHDLIIWTAGDFDGAFGEEESELLFTVLVQGIPVLVSGAYVSDAGEQSVQRDIRVNDPTHPMAVGFEPQEIIDFVPGPSGQEYVMNVMADSEQGEGTAIPFIRGPGSAESGAPSTLVLEESGSGIRVVFIGFPPYLLPESAKTALISNTVDWLLGP